MATFEKCGGVVRVAGQVWMVSEDGCLAWPVHLTEEQASEAELFVDATVGPETAAQLYQDETLAVYKAMCAAAGIEA